MDEDVLLEEEPRFTGDQRAELMLGALVCGVVVLLLAMLVFVLHEAWPSFAHNGLGWFGPGGNVDHQIQAIFTSGDVKGVPQYTAPRLAADLEHDPDDRRRGRRSRSCARCSSRCSSSSSRRVAASACSSRSCGCWPACRR